MRTSDLSPLGSSAGRLSAKRLQFLGALLLLCYFIAGVVYSFNLAAVPRFYDEADYLKMSYNVIHGAGFSLDGIHPTASRPPGYIYFLAALRLFGADFHGLRIAQYLVLAATIMLVSRLGTEKNLPGGLLISTLLVICYPVLFYTGATLYPQTLSALLFVLALCLNLAQPRGLALNLGTGLVYGLLILEVPTFLFTLVVVQLTAWFLKLIRPRDLIIIILAASLMVGGWTIRNAAVFHRFVPISSNSGMNLLMGNNGQPSATEAAANSIMTPYFQHSIDMGFDEFQADDFYKQTALDWIEAHPGLALVNYFEKVLNFFNIVNGYTHEAHGEVSADKQMIMAISYLLLLSLLAWRLADYRRFPLTPREKLFLIVYVLSAFTSAIFFTRIRLRLPYDFLIIAVIALYFSRRLAERLPAASLSRPPDPV